MICIQCGAQNEDHISFCRQCGTNLQAVRSALLGVPPSNSQPLPAISPRLAPLLLICSTIFGVVSFAVLLGVVIAIIALGADPGSRLDPPSTIVLSGLVAMTGTVGIVFIIRMMLKMMSTMASFPAAPPAATPNRTIDAPHVAAALPPPRQPASVVEHTTANLPNYVRPGRDTSE